MSKVRVHLLRKIARESGANLRQLVRQFRGLSAIEIAEKCYG